MITAQEYITFRNALNKEREFMKALGKNSLNSDEQKQRDEFCGIAISNELRSQVELYEFHYKKPEKYFLYIDSKNWSANNWMGEKLGRVSFGREYRSGFGDIRQSIDVYGINGIKYHGTFYKSSGDYARIKAYKNQ